MVEMSETAAILHHATERSLVILDEVGCGTSTFDGLSLAWAITEHLADQIRCRCLFATHYHELTDLASEHQGIHNLTVAIAEQDDEVVFLHQIVPGAATKSYGVHVARLAGAPQQVLQRANEVLGTLDQLNDLSEQQATPPQQRDEAAQQLSLFQAPTPSATLRNIADCDVDGLSPRDALSLLYDLQQQARKEC